MEPEQNKRLNDRSPGAIDNGLAFTGLGSDFKDDNVVAYYFGAGTVGSQFDFTLQLSTQDLFIEDDPTFDDPDFEVPLGITYYWNILTGSTLNSPDIPEPGTLVLFMTGLTGLSLVAFRRRKR